MSAHFSVEPIGRVRNWWKPADLERFKAAAARLAAQYDSYKPFPDLAVNGKQTLNENLADLGGISAAYDAYRASLAGKAAPVEKGFGRPAVLSWLCTAVGIKVE